MTISPNKDEAVNESEMETRVELAVASDLLDNGPMVNLEIQTLPHVKIWQENMLGL